MHPRRRCDDVSVYAVPDKRTEKCLRIRESGISRSEFFPVTLRRRSDCNLVAPQSAVRVSRVFIYPRRVYVLPAAPTAFPQAPRVSSFFFSFFFFLSFSNAAKLGRALARVRPLFIANSMLISPRYRCPAINSSSVACNLHNSMSRPSCGAEINYRPA